MRRIHTLVVCSTMLLPGIAKPQVFPSDEEIRQILIDRIDIQHKSVGMVVGMVTPRGRRVLAYGHRNQGDSRSLDGDTVFEIGSITKIFTALLLSDMAQRGEVQLEDPVGKYLPSAALLPDAAGRPITLVDLATHTSGLPFFPPDVPLNDLPRAIDVVAGYTPERIYRFLSTWHPPLLIGSKWEYSNLGYGVLGLALASRASATYESLVRSRILAPLGMESTSIAISPGMKAHLAVGHDGKLEPAPPVRMPAFPAAGCLRSSANDMLTFLEAFLGYRKTPLAPAMAAMLEKRRSGPGFQQTVGWWVFSMGDRDGEFAFHAGDTPGFSSTTAFDVKSRVGVVVLSNASAGDGGLAVHLMRPAAPVETSAVLKARSERKEIPLSPSLADQYSGQYKISGGPAVGMVITIERQKGSLMFKDEATGPEGLRLHAESELTFFTTAPDLQVTFQRDDQGRVVSLTVHFAGTVSVAPRIGGPK